MLCVFDFDGTLADSKSAYYQAVRRYAEENNFPLPSQIDMDMAFGNPNPPFFKGWGSEEGFMQHLDTVFLMVDDILCEDPYCMPLYDGVYSMLESLKHDGLQLAIVTSRNLKPLQTVLKAHNIDAFFTTIRSAQDMVDKGYRGKPHPDKLNCVLRELNCSPDKAIMIGDTFMDVQMAKNAEVFALGVSWGYHDEEILRNNGADAIASTVMEMKNIILNTI